MWALLSSIPSSIGLVLGSLLIRRKSKEDTHLASLATAVQTWKDLAESNKKHWETCESKTQILEQEVYETRAKIWEATQRIMELESVVRMRKEER